MTEHAVLAEAIRDFYIRSHRVMDRLMLAEGTSFAKTKLLLFIRAQGAARSTDIVRAFGYAPRTVTEAIDALEREGLIRREADAADRRVKRLLLTAAGEDALAAAEPVRQQFITALFGALDAGERDQLAVLLGRLNTRLMTLDKDAGAADPA